MQIIVAPLKAQYIVQGVVTDSLTKGTIAIYLGLSKGNHRRGGMTDDKGVFSFKTYRPEARLVISAVGYHEYTRLIHPARGGRIMVTLAPLLMRWTRWWLSPSASVTEGRSGSGVRAENDRTSG